MSSAASGFEQLKRGMQATWMAGDFGQVAKYSAKGAEEFVARLNVQPGVKVLDVACGTGHLAIPGPRLGAKVTGIDIASNLLEQARQRAASEGLQATFEEGDAEQLSAGTDEFDIVMTMFGAMFAPRPEQVAAEMTRVCRPGGTIAMANWTPEGFIGEMFRAVGRRVPPPPGIRGPVEWGSEARVRELFGDRVTDLRVVPREFVFRFTSPEHFADYFREHY